MWRVAPVGPALSTIAPSPTRRSFNAKLPELTVEWTGRYSADKTLALFAYAAASTNSSTAAWLLLTPLVALVCPLLLELLPLDDPFSGLRSNDNFLIRTALRIAIISFLIDLQTELYIPEQRLPRAQLLVMNAIQGAVMSVGIIVVAAVTGAFPIPFSVITVAPFYLAFAWFVRAVFVRLFLPVETDPVRVQRIQHRLRQVMRLVTLRVAMLYVYNLSAAAFAQVGDNYQIAMAVVLQLVKVGLTWYQWRLSHISDDDSGDVVSLSGDLAAAHVASGARFFHALFTTACLQKSKSILTMVVIVSFSLLQDTMTLHALHHREQRLADAAAELAHKMEKRQLGLRPDNGVRETMMKIAERTRVVQTLATPLASANRTCQRPPQRREFPVLTAHETVFFESATRLLHFQEAVLLRLYVEIFAPIVYIAYVALVQHSPNIQYLPALQLSESNNLATLSRRLAIPLAFKIISSLIMVRRHCREPGGLRQLAFALSSMHVIVLNSSVWNTLCVFDFALLHNGHDFTFQFKWLRSHG